MSCFCWDFQVKTPILTRLSGLRKNKHFSSCDGWKWFIRHVFFSQQLRQLSCLAVVCFDIVLGYAPAPFPSINITNRCWHRWKNSGKLHAIPLHPMWWCITKMVCETNDLHKFKRKMECSIITFGACVSIEMRLTYAADVISGCLEARLLANVPVS